MEIIYTVFAVIALIALTDLNRTLTRIAKALEARK